MIAAAGAVRSPPSPRAPLTDSLDSPTPRRAAPQNNAEHAKCARFLEQGVAYALQQGLKPVVLTHYAPSLDSTSHPRYEQGNSKFGFATQLRCAPGTIHLWAAGHTHYNYDHGSEGYRLVSNQFGYRDEPMPRYKRGHSIQL